MFVTVAICTRNRAASLSRTLRSLSEIPKPAGLDWELIVVDNGSTDATASTCEEFAKILPLRRVFEQRPGLSNARNAAVAAARGHYVVWTDDDVVVGRNWLFAYVEAFRTWPDAAVFGGRITPVFEGSPPPWFRDNQESLASALAARDFGDEPLPLSVADDRLPFGANYAIRAAEQRRFLYDPNLGAAPGRSRLGEETKAIEAILRSGGAGRWVPMAQVEHCIGVERQTIQYVKQYYMGHGRTAALEEGRSDDIFLFGVPRWLWLSAVRGYVRYVIARLASPASVWVENLKSYGYARGMLDYWLNSKRHLS